MTGSPDNQNPASLFKAPVEQVASLMVKIIRELKPDVIITHDAGGGYGHPDHIATHNAVVKAFYAASDPAQFPKAGPPFQPVKLYFGIRPAGIMKIAVRLMPLLGQNPRKFGRNKDIDLTKMLDIKYPVHAIVRLKNKSLETRDEASACHASQGGGGPVPAPSAFSVSSTACAASGITSCGIIRRSPANTSKKTSSKASNNSNTTGGCPKNLDCRVKPDNDNEKKQRPGKSTVRSSKYEI